MGPSSQRILHKKRKESIKQKYCRFHKCHGHLTDDCIHLKDAIEMLIQRGWLKQFTKNSEPERQAIELITDVKEKNQVVAMTVEQLNTFPEHMDVTPYNVLMGTLLRCQRHHQRDIYALRRKHEEEV